MIEFDFLFYMMIFVWDSLRVCYLFDSNVYN